MHRRICREVFGGGGGGVGGGGGFEHPPVALFFSCLLVKEVGHVQEYPHPMSGKLTQLILWERKKGVRVGKVLFVSVYLFNMFVCVWGGWGAWGRCDNKAIKTISMLFLHSYLFIPTSFLQVQAKLEYIIKIS